MELWQELICGLLKKEKVNIPDGALDINTILYNECYKALDRIKSIIQDVSLEDKECFMKIEEIICTLEDLGSNGGTRHDF